ncbi:MAG: NAD(P)-dependent oxidoreductase [Pirellulaceae bacterium]
MLGNEISSLLTESDANQGILGDGQIGQAVGRLARGFGMSIETYGRENTPTDLAALFSRSDFVSIHLPLTPETKGMVDRSLLTQMKATSFLINLARGGVVNQADLVDALTKGTLAGAALDVLDVEPPLDPNHPLLKFGQVVATPHIGFNTREAVAEKGEIALANIAAYCAEHP